MGHLAFCILAAEGKILPDLPPEVWVPLGTAGGSAIIALWARGNKQSDDRVAFTEKITSRLLDEQAEEKSDV